jgi:hypothetical protein
MTQGKPCTVWIADFLTGMEDGHKKKLFVMPVDAVVRGVVLMLRVNYPGTTFTVHNTDAAVITLPNGLVATDFVYQPSGLRFDSSGNAIRDADLSPESQFADEDEGAQIIVMKPPVAQLHKGVPQ